MIWATASKSKDPYRQLFQKPKQLQKVTSEAESEDQPSPQAES